MKKLKHFKIFWNYIKDDKLKLGIITIDLSDIKNINGEQLYKGFFEKFKEMCDNELCDI